jgi:hypothetical protein
MTDENLTPPNVPEMLRTTGMNTSVFMQQVADHISKLEEEVIRLRNRVLELEAESGNSTKAQ